MNKELIKVRDRISTLRKELLQLEKKEATLSQVSNPPDIVGKYFKIIDSIFTFCVKVKRVQFDNIFNDYVVIGPSVQFEGATVIMRSDSPFSYDSSTWEEITKEDYDKVLKEALIYF